MDEDSSIDFALQGSDANNQSLTYSVVTDASNGSVSLFGNIITYTPNANWNGTDTLTWY